MNNYTTDEIPVDLIKKGCWENTNIPMHMDLCSKCKKLAIFWCGYKDKDKNEYVEKKIMCSYHKNEVLAEMKKKYGEIEIGLDEDSMHENPLVMLYLLNKHIELEFLFGSNYKFVGEVEIKS